MDAEVKELCRTIAGLGPFTHWKLLAHGVAQAALNAGWAVEADIETPYVIGESTRRGRIPLLAKAGGHVVAIELGRRTARRRSLLKLEAFRGATDRLVVLREAVVRPHRIGSVVVFATRPTDAITRALARAQKSRRT